MKNLVLITMLIFASIRCCKDDDIQKLRVIYKTKGDYFNLASCVLNNDKTKIVAYYDSYTTIKRYQLSNDFVFAKDLLLKNKNIAFFNLTQEEFQNKLTSVDTTQNFLFKYILDSDPFIERYITYTYDVKDTVRINEIIQKGEMSKYFERIN